MAMTNVGEEVDDEPVLATFTVTAAALLPGDRLVPTQRVILAADADGFQVNATWTDDDTGETGTSTWARGQNVKVERAVDGDRQERAS